jgi:hypothetical protein
MPKCLYRPRSVRPAVSAERRPFIAKNHNFPFGCSSKYKDAKGKGADEIAGDHSVDWFHGDVHAACAHGG